MLSYYHGPDTYRLHNAITDVVAQVQKSSQHPVSIHTLDGASVDGRQELERLLKYPSFFEEKIIILLSGVLADAETADAANELLLRYNIASLPDTHVYVCQEEPAGRASAASKKLLAYLKKHSSVSMEFPVLTGTPLAQWIIDACATQGCAIAPAAISGLIQRAGGDSWRLAQEIAKLCAFTYASGEKSITPNAVHQLVPAVYERDEWELSNALAGKDKRGVLSALFRRISEGTPEQLLLGSLAAGIRTLMTVKDLSERHTPPALIAKTAALHPYVVTKTLRGASLYTSAQLRQTLSQLARLDREFKDGRADATDSLFQIVLEL